jgi:myosin heavy subunit
VDGINDSKEFQDVLNAMNVINISQSDQECIFKLISGILHLGNVTFVTKGNYAQPENMDRN